MEELKFLMRNTQELEAARKELEAAKIKLSILEADLAQVRNQVGTVRATISLNFVDDPERCFGKHIPVHSLWTKEEFEKLSFESSVFRLLDFLVNEYRP